VDTVKDEYTSVQAERELTGTIMTAEKFKKER
jgi:hypothetical protein